MCHISQCDIHYATCPKFPKIMNQALKVEGESDFTSMTVVSKPPGQHEL